MWLLSGWVGVTKFGSLKAKEFQRHTVLALLYLKEQVIFNQHQSLQSN